MMTLLQDTHGHTTGWIIDTLENIAAIYSLILEATFQGSPTSHDTHRVFKTAMFSKAFTVTLLLVTSRFGRKIMLCSTPTS